RLNAEIVLSKTASHKSTLVEALISIAPDRSGCSDKSLCNCHDRGMREVLSKLPQSMCLVSFNGEIVWASQLAEALFSHKTRLSDKIRLSHIVEEQSLKALTRDLSFCRKDGIAKRGVFRIHGVSSNVEYACSKFADCGNPDCGGLAALVLHHPETAGQWSANTNAHSLNASKIQTNNHPNQNPFQDVVDIPDLLRKVLEHRKLQTVSPIIETSEDVPQVQGNPELLTKLLQRIVGLTSVTAANNNNSRISISRTAREIQLELSLPKIHWELSNGKSPHEKPPQLKQFSQSMVADNGNSIVDEISSLAEHSGGRLIAGETGYGLTITLPINAKAVIPNLRGMERHVFSSSIKQKHFESVQAKTRLVG
ncbi:MAG: hypothetical protein AAF217_12550, partial [Pseudomonadota bacterium]